MNRQELENALLLHDSGELPEPEVRRLEAHLAEHPEDRSIAEEFHVLQEAGRFASRETVPPVDEVLRERLRSVSEASQPKRTLPRLMALAAGIAIAVASLPLLLPPPSQPDLVPATVADYAPLTLDHDPLMEDLEQLEERLADWSGRLPAEDITLMEEEYWARSLLESGESI